MLSFRQQTGLYEIRKTREFETRLLALKDRAVSRRVKAGIERAEGGNFGDHRPERDGVHSMRFRTLGIRVYYCQVGNRVYMLLSGGGKNTKQEQTRDIDHAVEIMEREMGR